MKWLRRIFFGLVGLTLALWLAGWLIVRSCQPPPPPLPAAAAAVLQQDIVTRDGKQWVGECWLGEREGLPVLYLKGTPFAMGYANGRLTQARMHHLEDAAIEMARHYVPQAWALEVIKDYVIYRNRHLPRYVATRYQEEILGLTRGCSDIHPEIGPFYSRLLNYHAAHDISYMLIDNPLVNGNGCTAFGAWGRATADGHLISGRNFDWEAHPVFDRERVLILCEPDGGIPFVSLAWAGMAGVVSGMNRAGVSVTVNGAPSELPGEIGTPAALLGREILETAHNLAEATAILTKTRVFVSTLWLIGSRSDGRFIVIEKTPQTTHVREPVGERILCVNHFQTAELEAAPRNVAFRAESTSVARLARLDELLVGGLTVARAAEILRDRNLTGGQFAGNGHRSSLNALIATHSTVMDLTAGIIWAAAPPHQLGQFVAVDVNDFARLLPEQTLPADAFLAEYSRYEQSQQCLAAGARALKSGAAATALEQASRAETLNPGFYQNAILQGRALRALGRTNEAARAFAAALAGQPAFSKERVELEALIHAAR